MLIDTDIYIISRQMVMQLMITVSFCVDAFVWRRDVSQVFPLLIIVEGTILDFNKHFHIIFESKFIYMRVQPIS